MLIPEFRKFMHADFERDGDEGDPRRHALRARQRPGDGRGLAPARAVRAHAVIREWNAVLRAARRSCSRWCARSRRTRTASTSRAPSARCACGARRAR
jgi:hypothetical protein